MKRSRLAVLLSVILLVTSLPVVPALAESIAESVVESLTGEETADEVTELPEENSIEEDSESIDGSENSEESATSEPEEGATVPSESDVTDSFTDETADADDEETTEAVVEGVAGTDVYDATGTDVEEATAADAGEATVADAEEATVSEAEEEIPVTEAEVYINGIPVEDTYYDLNTDAMAEYDCENHILTIQGEFDNTASADSGNADIDSLIDNSSIAYFGDGKLTVQLAGDTSFSDTRAYGIKSNGADIAVKGAAETGSDASPYTLSLTASRTGIDLSDDSAAGDLDNEAVIDVVVISGDGETDEVSAVLAGNLNNNSCATLTAKVVTENAAKVNVYAIHVLDTLSNSGTIIAESGDSEKCSFGIYTPENILIRSGASVTALSGSAGLSSFAICADSNLFVDSATVSARSGDAQYNSVGIYGGYNGAFIAINSVIESVSGNASDTYGIDADKSISIIGGNVSAIANESKSSSTGINTPGDISIGVLSETSQAAALAELVGAEISYDNVVTEVNAEAHGTTSLSYAFYAEDIILFDNTCIINATSDNQQNYNKTPVHGASYN